MLWTVILVITGIGGLWLVEKHPTPGWILYTLNEVLWGAYALTIHAPALFIMAWLWGLLGIRNFVLARRLRT